MSPAELETAKLWGIFIGGMLWGAALTHLGGCLLGGGW